MRAELGWPDDEFIVLHTGNMGNKQGLENAVRAARLADIHALRVRFVLLGDGSQRSRLEQAGQGVERLQFLDPVCDEIYAEVLSAADALLINERETVFNMSLPSKLTSYFAAGRPVIAAVSRDGTTARELLRAQAGMVAEPNNPKELLETALALMLDPDTNSKYAVNARLYARRNLEKSASLRRVEELILDLADASNQLGARATGL
jgi:glycosyltransferase involved in cell wall biosynthesis